MMNGRGLYRLLFGTRTVLIEGYLSLAGLLLLLAGRWLGHPWLVRVGLWMAAPFLATLVISLLVLAPWFAIRGKTPPGKE